MNLEQQPVDRLSYHTANEKGILVFNKVLANAAHSMPTHTRETNSSNS